MTWRRARDGKLIPGVILSIGPKKARVRIAARWSPTSQWVQAIKYVPPDELLPREEYVPEVDLPSRGSFGGAH